MDAIRCGASAPPDHCPNHEPNAVACAWSVAAALQIIYEGGESPLRRWVDRAAGALSGGFCAVRCGGAWTFSVAVCRTGTEGEPAVLGVGSSRESQPIGLTFEGRERSGGVGGEDATGMGFVPVDLAEPKHASGSWCRSEVYPDEFWERHPIRAGRGAMGLDEFCRASVVIPTGPDAAPTRVVLQADAPVGAAFPAGADKFLEVMAPALAHAFVAQVQIPARRRESLLLRISPSQRQILPLLVEGKSEREIATVLHRSPHTVHDHVKSIYSTLGITSRYELLALWTQAVAPRSAA